ncbi:MAG: tRNA dihydrouridine synthase DusB, partial [Ignavibacteriaceae bacterium]
NELMETGSISTVIDEKMRIQTCLRHLELAIKVKGKRRAILEHRKFYTGYLKGFHNVSEIRKALMVPTEYNEIEEILLSYLEYLTKLQIAV